MIFWVIYVVASIVCLVCWIMEVVAAFQKGDGPLLGILSIVLTVFCGIGGFVIGWVKCNEWGIQKLMIIWTISIIVGAVAYAFVAQELFSGFQEEMQQQMQNAQ